MYPYEEKSGYKKGLATEVQPSITFFSQLLMDLQYPNFAQPPAQPDDHKNHCQERKEEGAEESLRSSHSDASCFDTFLGTGEPLSSHIVAYHSLPCPYRIGLNFPLSRRPSFV